MFIGKNDDKTVIELESWNTNFLEDKFPSKGKIKEIEPLFEMSNSGLVLVEPLGVQEDNMVYDFSGSQYHQDDLFEPFLGRVLGTVCPKVIMKLRRIIICHP